MSKNQNLKVFSSDYINKIWYQTTIKRLNPLRIVTFTEENKAAPSWKASFPVHGRLGQG